MKKAIKAAVAHLLMAIISLIIGLAAVGLLIGAGAILKRILR